MPSIRTCSFMPSRIAKFFVMPASNFWNGWFRKLFSVSGKYRSVFSNPVRTYDILPGRGARTIRFSMHGGYCDTYGAATCYKRKRITAKPFEFKDR